MLGAGAGNGLRADRGRNLEQQVGNVNAGDEKNQTDRTEQDQYTQAQVTSREPGKFLL
jgi:hypothetical protein